MELYRAIQKDDDHQYAKETLDFIVQTIDSFGLECVSICFNGGKDCTVLLHLLAAALAYIRQRDNIPPPTTHDGRVTSSHDAIVDIPVVYFKVDREFDELYQFNNDMMDMYNFKMVEFDGTDMKQCLYNMLDYYPKMKVRSASLPHEYLCPYTPLILTPYLLLHPSAGHLHGATHGRSRLAVPRTRAALRPWLAAHHARQRHLELVLRASVAVPHRVPTALLPSL